MIKQAIILSAGLGTRLRPYTDTLPKPMISILGKPMLEWHIEQFKKSGVTEFFFNLHYLPEVIKNYFGDGSKWGVTIYYNIEPIILGTAGAIKAFDGLLDEEFFLIYGDIFSLLNYKNMETAWRKKIHPIGMQLVKRTDDYIDADVAIVDQEGKFIAIHAKPHKEAYPNAYRMRGIFIFNKKILSYIPTIGGFEIGSQLLPELIAIGESLYAYESSDYSKGIDTMEKLKEVEEFLRRIFSPPRS